MTLTENLIDGSGSNTYNFTFPILDQQDVKVQLREFDPNLPPEERIVSQISTTAFDVFSSPNRIVFQPIPEETIYQDANGDVKVTSDNGYQVVIRIYRDTDIDGTAAYFYPGSAIRAEDLNDNFRQLLFNAQESAEELEDILGGIFPDDSIPGSALKDGAVTTDKIADGAVTPDKLDREYVEPGDNVSELVNDANYLSVGDNVSELVNDLEYLEPGDNVSELTNDAGYITAAEVPPTGVTKLIAGNNVTISPSTGTGVVTVNSTGGGGGGGGGETKADIYGTAKVRGIAGGGVGTSLIGCTVSVSPLNADINRITFNTPQPDTNYEVVLGPTATTSNVVSQLISKTTTYFDVGVVNLTSGQYSSDVVDFALFDNQPAEIIVGSGTVVNTNLYGTAKAWGSFDGTGSNAEFSSFNIESFTRSAAGTYDVVFATPMPNNEYVVTGNYTSWANEENKTTTGFTLYTYATGAGGILADLNTVDFAVHDNTPAEVALTTFGDVINYSGASAWGDVASDGTLNGGLNIGSVTRTSAGKYSVVFATPLGSSVYAPVINVNTETNVYALPDNQTATGFDVIVRDAAGTYSDLGFVFAVFATNSLPPKGGTGTDAWGSWSNATGDIRASFNIDSIVKTGTGQYTVTFTTPMPIGRYSVTASSQSRTQLVSVTDKSSTEFRVNTTGVTSSTREDASFDFQVNATNATLPATVTQEQIESAINNPGASAWGSVIADGNLEGGLNIASVTKTGTGIYDVVFTTSMPNSNYSVVGSCTGIYSATNFTSTNQTAAGFTIQTYDTVNAGSIDASYCFTVFATNALPPKGGTGADAWCTSSGDGFNIASVTQGGGNGNNWTVVFTTPMPSDDYAVVATPVTSSSGTCFVRNRTSTGFQVVTRDYDGSNLALGWTAVVHATNATLPLSFTSEQIESAINNPGCSAWGSVTKTEVNGPCEILANLNVASVTRTDVGKYDVVFTTPMPSDYYAVNTTPFGIGTGLSAKTLGKTTSGFTVYVLDTSNALVDFPFDLTVFSTNALPPKGGTGTDAWGSAQSDGTLDASFNVASVTRTGTGLYDVVFTTPMPSSSYATTVSSGTNQTRFLGQTTTGFIIETRNANGNVVDSNTAFQVNATNATLPSTFTEAQIQAVVDLAQTLNQAQVAKAWASVNSGGTLAAIYNIASVNNSSVGVYEVVFATPMPSAYYSVSTAITSNTYAVARPTNKTANGFTMRTLYSNGGTPTAGAYAFDFQVFSN